MKKRVIRLRRALALLTLAALCVSLAGCGGGKGTVPAAAVQTITGSITERTGTVQDRSLHLFDKTALEVPMASSGLMQLFLDDNSFGIALYEKTREKYWYALPPTAGSHYDDSAATVTLDVLYGNTLYKLSRNASSPRNAHAFRSNTCLRQTRPRPARSTPAASLPTI